MRYDLLGSVRTQGVRCDIRRYRHGPDGPRIAQAPQSVLSYHVGPAPKVMLRHATAARGRSQRRGSLAYLDRTERWECETDGTPITALMAFFEDGFSGQLGSDVDPHALADPLLQELMALVYAEMRAPNHGSRNAIEAAVSLMRVKLCRLMVMPPAALASEPGVGLSSDQLALFTGCIRSSRGSTPSIELLARTCGMSRRTLIRRFVATTGQTIAEFISADRDERAKALLSGSDLSIKEIAYEVGYTTPSNFGSAFKRRLGETPAQFRLSRRSLGNHPD